MKAHAVSEESLLMAMREAVDGLVEPQGTVGYVRESSVFNTSAVPLPAAVVVPRDAKDLARAVRTAVGCGFTVAVQSTGHAATAVDSRSILVNTRMLDTLVIDPAARTATVGAGVRWRDLLTAAGKHGLAGLAGSAPDVGVVGYTLGGGLGPVARTFGFAADHVVSVDVVTADGDLRTVDESRHPDLFWALRGGGGAFGIVTEITVRLFNVPTLLAGGIFFDIDDARRVLHGWRNWVQQVPDAVNTSVALLNLPPRQEIPESLRGRSVLHVRYAYVGDVTEGLEHLEPIRALASPVIDGVMEIPFSELGAIHAEPTQAKPTAERSTLLRELPPEAVEAFFEAFSTLSPALIVAEIRALGGALAAEPAQPNAIGGRSAAFSVFGLGLNTPPRAEPLAKALTLLLRSVAPWSTGGALMNFAGGVAGAPLAQVRSSWSTQTYGRLTELRRRHDPLGSFDPVSRW